MGDENWALKAIEREAMSRARQQVTADMAIGGFRYMGATSEQIQYVMAWFTTHTGIRPEMLDLELTRQSGHPAASKVGR